MPDIDFFSKRGTIFRILITYARLAQLVEQFVYTEKVGSSSLSSRTKVIYRQPRAGGILLFKPET